MLELWQMPQDTIEEAEIQNVVKPYESADESEENRRLCCNRKKNLSF